MHPEEVGLADRRGYNVAWRSVWKQFLQVHPLCEECRKNGRLVKATVVDYVISHRGYQKLFGDRSNRCALCKRCHDGKTRREDQTLIYYY